MNAIIAWFVARGVPAALAKPILIAALAALAIGALFGAKAIYDHAIVKAHDAARAAAQAQDTVNAIHRADDADEAIRRDAVDRARALEEAERNAIQSHPQAARGSVGPATGAVLDQLRNRAGR